MTHFRAFIAWQRKLGALHTSPPSLCPSVGRQRTFPRAPFTCELYHDQQTCLKAVRYSVCCSVLARSTHTNTYGFVLPLQLPRCRAKITVSMSTTIQQTTSLSLFTVHPRLHNKPSTLRPYASLSSVRSTAARPTHKPTMQKRTLLLSHTQLPAMTSPT